MQTATIVHNPDNTHTIIKAVADKLNIIGSNTYVQLGTMLTLIGTVIWVVTFKVTIENTVSRLYEENQNLRIELKELKTGWPSKDWLELKFSNLEGQLQGAKSKGK